eukprot:2873826-Alexandrium_andersonii.AAC.1
MARAGCRMWPFEGRPHARAPSLTWLGGSPPARGWTNAPWEGMYGNTRDTPQPPLLHSEPRLMTPRVTQG